MPNKFCQISIVYVLYETGQDCLDIQCTVVVVKYCVTSELIIRVCFSLFVVVLVLYYYHNFLSILLRVKTGCV